MTKTNVSQTHSSAISSTGFSTTSFVSALRRWRGLSAMPLAAALALLLAAPLARAAASNWTGGNSSNDWFDDTNWGGSGTPGSTTDTTIDTDGTFQPVIDGNPAVSGFLTIGSTGSSGANTSLTITNGGMLTTSGAFSATIGFASGSTGAVLVDASTWNLGELFVGKGGSGNLTVTNSGNINSSLDTQIGSQAGSTGNVVLTGASTWYNTGGVVVVGDLGTGYLTVSGGSLFDATDQNLYVGNQETGRGNVTITGTGSQLLASQVQVGVEGSGNLAILAGGNLTNTSASYIGEDTGSFGNVSVDGAGSVWNAGGVLYVGADGTGNLSISGGGNVTAASTTYIGASSSSTGQVSVNGGNSVLNLGGALYVGQVGTGNLSISNGGNVNAAGSVNIGSDIDSHGDVSVDGTNSTLTTTSSMIIASSGFANVSVSGGGNITVNDSHIAAVADSAGNLSVDGTGSTFVSQSFLIVGDSGTGNVSVTDHGNVTVGTDLTLANEATGVGNMSVSGTGSVLNVGETLSVGKAGSSNLSISSGGNVTVANTMSIGANAGSNGTVTVDGTGSVLVAAGIIIGDAGIGTLTITNGGLVNAGDGVSLTGDEGNATLNLNDGELDLAGLSIGLGNATFNWNGGTLKALDNFSTVANATLGASTTATLDSNGKVVTFDGNLTGDGSFTKIGDGTLELSGTNDYTGDTTVDGGTLKVSGTISSTGFVVVGDTHDATLTINDGIVTVGDALTLGNSVDVTGTLNLNDGGTLETSSLAVGDGNYAFNLNGGTLRATDSFTISLNATLGSGTTSFLDTNCNCLTYAGNITGDGSLAKTGKGILELSGTNDYTGDTTVDRGTLKVTGSITNTDNLIIGESHSATLTITNGGLVVVKGTLTLGNLSTGTLNLNDGELDTFSLNNGDGDYTFNWNGGTLKATDTFSTSVDATLGDSTTATFNTNGSDVTYSGELSGSGSFKKIGDGTLSLTAGSNYSGNTTIDGGTLTLTDSGQISATNNVIVGDASTAELTITDGGYMSASSVTLGSQDGSMGTLNLNDGELVTSSLVQGLGNYAFNLNGGTLVANDSFTISLNATLGDGTTSVFNTNCNCLTYAGNITGSGSLSKVGWGTLELSGNNDYTGDTTIDGGKLKVTGSITGTNDVKVGYENHVKLIIADGGLVVVGGNLTLGDKDGSKGTLYLHGELDTASLLNGAGDYAVHFDGGTLKATGNFTTSLDATLGNSTTSTLDTNGNDVTYSGGLSGNGSFKKIGDGTLTMNGTSNYTGDTTIDGGTLTLTDSGEIASTNNVIVGDANTAELTITDGGYMAANAVTLGNQGGSMGTLNLNVGGELATGSLAPGSGNYIFNFAGGTLMAATEGSSFSADATLADGTTSTIDTDGYNATWSGALSGNGAFAKDGGQTLTIASNFAATGNVEVMKDTLNISGGSLYSPGNSTIDDGATLILDNQELVADANITGAGLLKLTETTTLDGDLHVQNTDLLGSVSGTNTTIYSDGNFTWESAASLQSGVSLTLNGTTTLGDTSTDNSESLIDTVNNSGHATVYSPSDGNFGLSDSGQGTAVWNNLDGSSFKLEGTASILGSPDSHFNNELGANFRKGGGDTSIVNWGFTNDGHISIYNGTLEFQGMTFNGGGNIHVYHNGSLEFDNVHIASDTSTYGNGTVLIEDTVTLAGFVTDDIPVSVTANNLTLDGSADLTGSGNVSVASNFTWKPGATVDTGITLSLSGNSAIGDVCNDAYLFLYGIVDNSGNATLRVVSSDTVGLNDNDSGTAVWNNNDGSVFTMKKAANILGSSDSHFYNNSGASFVFDGYCDSLGMVQWSFTNNGNITVNAGTLEFTGITFGGSGSATVADGATLEFDNVSITSDTATSGNGTVLLENTVTIGSIEDDLSPVAITADNFRLDGSANLTGSGNVTVAANFTWKPGATVDSGITLNLNGNSTIGDVCTDAYLFLYGIVNNSGNATVHVSSSDTLGLNDNDSGTAVWNNLSGSNFTLVKAANILGSSDSHFYNNDGASFIFNGYCDSLGMVEWSFTNNGNITVNAGTLEFSGMTFDGSGSSTIASGATLEFDNVHIASDTATSGDGTVEFEDTVTLAGLILGGNPVAVTTNNFTLDADLTGAGNVSVDGNFTWEPGASVDTGITLTLSSNTTSTIGATDTSNYEYLYGTVDNSGNATVYSPDGPHFGLNDGSTGTAVWNNHSGAIFTLNGTASVTGSSESHFNNDAGATIIKAGLGDALFEWGLTNNGNVDVQIGNLELSFITVDGTGNVTVASGSELQLETVTIGGTQTTSGDGVVVLKGSTTTDGPGTLNVGNDLTWKSGAAIDDGLTLNITGTTTLGAVGIGGYEYIYNSTVNNSGYATVYTSEDDNFGIWDSNSGSAVWNNLSGSTFKLEDMASIVGSSDSLFNNQLGARFTKGGGNTSLVEWSFINDGHISIYNGTLEFKNNSFSGSGNVHVFHNGVLEFDDVSITSDTSTYGSGTVLLEDEVTLGTSLADLSPVAVTADNLVLDAEIDGMGNVSISNNFTWNVGGYVDSNITLTLSGTSTIGDTVGTNYEFLGGTVDNSGNATVYSVDGSNYGLNNNPQFSVWNNLAGSTFTLNGTASITGDAMAVFNNDANATFIKTNGGDAYMEWNLTNNGNIDVQGGNLVLSSITFDGTGNTTIESGASLVLASVTLSGNQTTSGDGTVILPVYDYLYGPGVLNVGNDFTWQYGASLDQNVTLNLGGTTTIGDTVHNAYEYINNGTVNNSGSATVYSSEAANYGLYDSGTGLAVWNNLSGSSLKLEDMASIIGSSDSLFNNEAGARFTKGGGNTSVVDWSFINNGHISIYNGTLQFTNDNFSGSGNVHVFHNGILEFDGTSITSDTSTYGSGQVLLVDEVTLGTNEVDLSPITLTGNNVSLRSSADVDGSGNISVSGNFAWAPGATVESGITLTLSGNSAIGDTVGEAYENLYGTVNNGGTATVEAAGNIAYGLYDGSTGTAVWNNLANATFTLNGTASVIGSSNSHFINNVDATIVKTGAGLSQLHWGLTNNGNIDVQGGALRLVDMTYDGTGNALIEDGAELHVNEVTLASTTSTTGAGNLVIEDLYGSGAINVGSNLTWSANSIVDTNVTLNLSSNTTSIIGDTVSENYEYLYGTINNNGAASLRSSSDARYGLNDNGSGTAVWNNNSGSSLSLMGKASILGSSDSHFTNDVGASFIVGCNALALVQWSFTNNGNIAVNSGNLEFGGIDFDGNGTIEVASGANLLFSTVNILNDTAVTGDGTVLLYGTDALGSFDGNITTPSNLDTVNLTLKGGVDLTGVGAANVTGNFVWEPGASVDSDVTINLGGTSSIGDTATSSNYEYLYGTVNNSGHATSYALSGETLGLYDANSGTARWNNLSGSSFKMEGGASIIGSSTSYFDNQLGARFTKGGGNISVVHWGFNNDGHISVYNGILEFAGITFTGHGDAHVHHNGILEFAGTSIVDDTLTYGNGTVLINGSVTLGNFTGNVALPATLTANNLHIVDELTGLGAANVTGNYTQDADTVVDGGITLTLSGTSTIGDTVTESYTFIYGQVLNSGNATVYSADTVFGGIYGNETSTWDNLSGASLTLNGTAGLIGSTDSHFTNNAGASVIKDGATDDTSYINWSFSNDGSVTINNGTLNFQSTVYNGTGTIAVNDGATLKFDNTQIASNTSVDGNGTVRLENTVTLSELVSHIDPINLTANSVTIGHTADVSGFGNVTSNTNLTWEPSASVEANITLNLNGNSSIGDLVTGQNAYLAGTVNNSGNATIYSSTGGNFGLFLDGQWNNLSNSTITLEGNASLLGSPSAQYHITNEVGASFIKEGGNSSLVYGDSFTNNGTITVNTGTLEFKYLTLASADTAALTVSDGATVKFTQTSFVGNTTIGGNGTTLLTGHLELGPYPPVGVSANLTTNTSLVLDSALDLYGVGSVTANGNVNWNPGATVENNITLNLHGTSAIGDTTNDAYTFLYGTVNNSGSATLDSLTADNAGLDDGNTGTAVWNNLSGSTFTINGTAGIFGSSESQFVNAAGASFFKDSSDTSFIEWTLVNNGVIEVDNGTLHYSTGDLSNDGDIAVNTGGNLVVDGALIVGDLGVGNLIISDSTVGSAGGIIGNMTGASGNVVVTGESLWDMALDWLTVGDTGLGNLSIVNGGTVNTDNAIMGNASTGSGTALVDGTNSTWNVTNTLTVGGQGTGALTVDNGGLVNSGHVALGNSGTLNLNNSGVLATNDITNAGSGIINFNGGIVRATGNSTDYLANFTAGQITLGTNGGTIDDAGFNLVINAPLGGTGNLTKSGSGVVSFSSASVSTYSGATIVNQGTFNLNGSLTQSSVVVNTGAQITGNGTIGGSLTLHNNAIVAPGNSIGTLTVNGTTTWNGSSNQTPTALFDLSNIDSASDLLAVGGNLTKGSGSDYTFDFGDTGFGTPTTPTIYTLITYGGSTDFVAHDFSYVNLGDGVNFSGYFNVGSGAVTFIVVPEPSTYALALGAVALLVAARRRKRS